MDKVRFGRALGYGARHTAKALYKAVDAARAPATAEPAQATAAHATATKPTAATPAASPQPSAQRPAAMNRPPLAGDAGKHAKALGRSVWSPLARFSGVLWLQVTGSVYAVIALAMGQAAWLRRADLRLSVHSSAAQRAWLLLGIFGLFAYFAASSFIRAHRRERR
jgi:hypothetical protein